MASIKAGNTLWGGIALVALGCCPWAIAQTNPSDALLKQHGELSAQLRNATEAGMQREALETAHRLLPIQRQLTQQSEELSESLKRHRDLVSTLKWLAAESKSSGETSSDEPSAISIARQTEIVKLTDEIQSISSRIAIEELSEEELEDLERSKVLMEKGKAEFESQKIHNAIKTFETCLEMRSRTLGDNHALTRECSAWLPYLTNLIGDYEQAREWSIRERKLNEKHLGDHPSTARSIHSCALTTETLGEFEAAKALYEDSLRMRRKIYGAKHRSTAIAHNALGLIHMWTGDYARAQTQLQHSLDAVRALNIAEIDVAANLQNLALLSAMVGDHLTAKPLYVEALSLASEHPTTKSQILDNMGLMFLGLEDIAESRSCFKRSMEAIVPETPLKLESILVDGDDISIQMVDSQFESDLESCQPIHFPAIRKIARTLNNFAQLCAAEGAHQKAQRLYRQSLKIAEMLSGKSHPEAAACIDNLGCLQHVQGNIEEAEESYRTALAIRTQTLGSSHAETAVSYSHLGMLRLAQGDRADAKEYIGKSLSIRRRLLDETATVQNERQQLLMNQALRSSLDDWLSVVTDESAYGEVLRWKGAVFLRQTILRTLRRRPELKPVVEELHKVSCQFAKLSLQMPQELGTHEKATEELRNKRQQLEKRLVSQCGLYRERQEQAALTPEGLQLQLEQQGDVVLVDFLEYERRIPTSAGSANPNGMRSFVAFVIRPTGPIRRIELGEASAIDRLVDDYRSLLQNPLGTNAHISSTAKTLREQLWDPIHEAIGQTSTVLVSPDGSLGKLPFVALPGVEVESYLIEDYALAILPVPQALAALLNYDEMPEVDGNVLVVGGVDYDNSGAEIRKKKRDPFARRKRSVPVSPAEAQPSDQPRVVTRASLAPWQPLSATSLELSSIRDTYETVRSAAGASTSGLSTLRDSSATEAAFREQAPKHRFLHIATHGFFAPESLVSALAKRKGDSRSGSNDAAHRFIGFEPGLLSGIVLAGANNPKPDGDDGVLTALEVSEMDLAGVELAVLSACETGLGRVAGGEGLLGLQRSFQVAGARSVVASLWKVEDAATSTLMGYFYENRWSEGMDTLEALRQAQLSMLNKDGRGRRIAQQDRVVAEKRTPPVQWAAFVLSGDWR